MTRAHRDSSAGVQGAGKQHAPLVSQAQAGSAPSTLARTLIYKQTRTALAAKRVSLLSSLHVVTEQY